MFRTILAPLDGSKIAEQALPTAARIARTSGASLHLVHVHADDARDPIFVNGLPVIDEHLHSLAAEHERVYLERVAATIASDDLEPMAVRLSGPVVRTLLRYARDVNADLIVLTTHGRSGFDRLWLGSVAESLARQAHAPLLLLRPSSRGNGSALRFGQVLVPLDGSPLAEEVIAPAAALAAIDHGALTLLRIVDTLPQPISLPLPERYRPDEATLAREEAAASTYLQDVAARLAPPGTRTIVSHAEQPARAIIETAHQLAVDLVALTTHGRSAVRSVAISSVADKVLRGIDRPLLVLRPGQQHAD
ncbi:MAG: universal stress protein [Oscillochloridaceae bacterium]|nr:universal stress protein [Chloroflexaceae bacterium]MDW8391567.1 universal stress protein [Oscillochloridaceae bacterium]